MSQPPSREEASFTAALELPTPAERAALLDRECAGTLSLSLINNFLPDDSDSFTLFKFGSASGSFANISGGRVSLTNNLASFAVTQSATNLVLGGVSYTDTDGDGQGDLPEQAAGTDANDPRNALAIIAITRNGSGHTVVQFQSVPAKNYRVEFSNDLVTWQAVPGASFTAPAANVKQWVDDGTHPGGLPSTRRFYRIGLQ